jgi:hypothetical protein
MKNVAALLVAFGLMVSLSAQTTPPVAPGTAPKAGTTPKSTPPAKAAKDSKKDVKKEEAPKIEGIEIVRGGGAGYLGVLIAENNSFKINFYDAKKKPTAPDVKRAVLRWDAKNKIGMDRALLTESGSFALASEKTVKPPYTFKLFITLLKEGAEGEETVGESYTIDFRQ